MRRLPYSRPERPTATLPRHTRRRRRGSERVHVRTRAAGPAARTRPDSKVSHPRRTLTLHLGKHLPQPPEPTRRTVGSTPRNRPTPQPARHSARRPREPSGSATWAPRRGRDDQTPPERRKRTTQLTLMNRVSYSLAYRTCLFLVLVLVLCLFVCLFVCLSVGMYAVVHTRARLSYPPLSCLPAAPGHRLPPYLGYRLY